MVVGPFDACSRHVAGKVCDASGKPLPTAPATPWRWDGRAARAAAEESCQHEMKKMATLVSEPTPGASHEEPPPPTTTATPSSVDIDALMKQIRMELAQRRGPTPQTMAAGMSVEAGAQGPPRLPLSTDEIMARVRAEVARRRGVNAQPGAPAIDRSLGLRCCQFFMPRFLRPGCIR